MKIDRLEQELASLRLEAARHNDLYYVKHAPEISDKAFDELLKRISALEVELNYKDVTSPTEHVGSDLDEHFPKCKHNTPMLSIQNSYSISDIMVFMNQCHAVRADATFTIEPKVDGTAISIIYENGVYTRATTRGDGTIGDDVTANVSTIKCIPKQIPFKEHFEVRGEIYMNKGEFNKYNDHRTSQGKVALSNPRNASAGSIKLHDIDEVRRRPLMAMFYMIPDAINLGCTTHVEELEILTRNGFPTVELIEHGNSEDIFEIVTSYTNQLGFDYPTDGAVIRVNELDAYGVIGTTNKFPKWICAYKCPADVVETELLDVIFQIGRTGVWTPVMILKPVELAGTTVSRATLHNVQYIRDLDIRVGDIVKIEKSGEIIPHIVGVSYEKRKKDVVPMVIPMNCDACGCGLSMVGPKLMCTNVKCSAKVYEQLIYFASKDCLDMSGVGPSTIGVLIDTGLLNDFSDFFKLTKDKLLAVGMKDKSADNLIKAINKAKQQPAHKVLPGIGISGVGRTVSKEVLRHCPSIMELKHKPLEWFYSIDGIGEIIAKSLYEYVHSSQGELMFQKLQDAGLNMVETVEAVDPNKKHYVITGETIGIPKRELAVIIQQRLNGVVDDRVTKQTETLFIGDTGWENSSKYMAAHKLGIPIKSIHELI